MSLNIILLTIHITLCSIGSIVVYAAMAAIAYGDVFRTEFEYDRRLFSALWPIFLTVHLLCMISAMVPFRKVGAGFKCMWGTFERLCNSIEVIAEVRESTEKVEGDIPEYVTPEPATCDVCKGKMKQGVYR